MSVRLWYVRDAATTHATGFANEGAAKRRARKMLHGQWQGVNPPLWVGWECRGRGVSRDTASGTWVNGANVPTACQCGTP